MMHEAVCSCRVLGVVFSFVESKYSNILYNQHTQREREGERTRVKKEAGLNLNNLSLQNNVEHFKVAFCPCHNR